MYLTIRLTSGIPALAGAFERPVLASNIQGLNEYIVHGKNGLLFDIGDEQSLVNSIHDIMDDDIYNRLCSNLQSRKDDPLEDWSQVVKKLEKVINTL